MRSVRIALVVVGCGHASPNNDSQRRPASAAEASVNHQSEDSRVSMSFVDALLGDAVESESDGRDGLLSHPAMVALVRHQRMSGNAEIKSGALLDRLVGSIRDPVEVAAVVDVWRGRDSELLAAADASAAMLPQGARFEGDIFFVAGYDIAVASPPDVVVNAAHPHFVAAPEEVAHYVTHEAHHVGFLAARPMPELTGLGDPEHLRAVIRFMTQMEGMAVHVAFEPRRAASALEADADYRVYRDAAYADQICDRYREVWALTETRDTLSGDAIDGILGAMSSGERLWYRFGALVAHNIEQTRGRRALVDSITEPEIFWSEATALLGTL